MLHSIYNKEQRTFHAGVGFTNQAASVYRYSKAEAEQVLETLDGNKKLMVVPYAFVFEILGTPGNSQKR